MARIRSIKPEFFTSLSIADLTRDARLLFVGLWTHVDDEGRCVDEPRLVKAAIFPLDDDLNSTSVDGLLDELSSKGRIIRYQDEQGHRYVQVVGWDHQKIDRRNPSKYPPPEDSSSAPRDIDDNAASDRRASDEDSSPDRIGSGSDRIGSGSKDLDDDSRAAPPVDNFTPADDDERFTHIIDWIVNTRTARSKPRNPRPYRAKVKRGLLDEQGEEIRTLCQRYPDAAASSIAAYVDGDQTALRYHTAKEHA